jgi:hypothetical protein
MIDKNYRSKRAGVMECGGCDAAFDQLGIRVRSRAIPPVTPGSEDVAYYHTSKVPVQSLLPLQGERVGVRASFSSAQPLIFILNLKLKTQHLKFLTDIALTNPILIPKPPQTIKAIQGYSRLFKANQDYSSSSEKKKI